MQWALTDVEEGDRLLVVPQKGNPYDSHAVAIYTLKKPYVMIGYVPRELNQHYDKAHMAVVSGTCNMQIPCGSCEW